MINYNVSTPTWEWVHKRSPAPRHRRRLILKLLKNLDFGQCLDVGCAQPYLLEDLRQMRPDLKIAGCDISQTVIEANRRRFPDAEFFVMDLAKAHDVRGQFDLVTCSEVLEHIAEWRQALETLARLSRRWLLVTVPCGSVFPIDEIVGHRQHFQGPDLLDACRGYGFKPVRAFHWGFPFHSLYRRMINSLCPERVYRSFAQQDWGPAKWALSSVLYGLFFLNDPFRCGSQFIALLEKSRA